MIKKLAFDTDEKYQKIKESLTLWERSKIQEIENLCKSILDEEDIALLSKTDKEEMFNDMRIIAYEIIHDESHIRLSSFMNMQEKHKKMFAVVNGICTHFKETLSL